MGARRLAGNRADPAVKTLLKSSARLAESDVDHRLGCITGCICTGTCTSSY
jgi:hypothetical protein